MNMQKLYRLIDSIVLKQTELTKHWHKIGYQKAIKYSGNSLLLTVKANHASNYLLWHTEDIVRRKDISDKKLVECKRKIDVLNQERTNYFEKIDTIFVPLICTQIKQNVPVHTETIGMIIDRLSILSLKIYHMKEQTIRKDVSADHLMSCKTKLKVLSQQQKDLIRATKSLIKECVEGKKQIKLYHSFKMYNDPNLNPQLYKESN